MTRVFKRVFPPNPFTGEPSGLEALEFLFPIDRKKIPKGRTLPPDFDRLASLTNNAIQSHLEKQWSVAKSKPVSDFVNLLKNFKVTSLTLFAEHWMLRLSLFGLDDQHYANNYYLAPQAVEQTEPFLKEFKLKAKAFAEFVKLFSGLGDASLFSGPTFAHGDFPRFADNPWSQEINYHESDEDDEDPNNWMAALCLYYATNGDIMLLNPTGETAWMHHGEHRIEKFTDSFALFLKKYTQFVSRYQCGFDGRTTEYPTALRDKALVY